MSDLSYAPISSVPVSDTFFDTLRADYPGFDEWLKRKGTESAYVARREDGGIDVPDVLLPYFRNQSRIA